MKTYTVEGETVADGLRCELEKAFGAGDLAQHPVRSRVRYILAIDTIAHAMENAGLEPAALDALFGLRDALVDLEKGIVNPALEPKKTQGIGNRPVDPTDKWLARASVSIAFHLLCTAGLSREEAARRIASQKHLGALKGRNAKTLVGAVKSWFDDFRNDRVRSEVAQELFDEVTQWTSNLSSSYSRETIVKLAMEYLKPSRQFAFVPLPGDVQVKPGS